MSKPLEIGGIRIVVDPSLPPGEIRIRQSASHKWVSGPVFDKASYDALVAGDVPLALEIDVAIQPLLAIEARARKMGHAGDATATFVSESVWQAIKILQATAFAAEQCSHIPPTDEGAET